ncbi:MAG: hypothetical protein N3F66_10495 [Spirochaetes bacterium]|nr:hypothetical protein [Spirochaetota bacterium]
MKKGTIMYVNSIKARTYAVLVKAILSKEDFDDYEIIRKIYSYEVLTPFYVKIALLFSVIYFNMISLMKKRAMMYSLKKDEIELLIKKIENTFYGQSLIMIVKLISTLVYFDDDIHAANIGYKHLEHCR